MLRRGFARRCPNCGNGKLFDSWFHIRTSCDHCGLNVDRERGFVTGAMYLSAVVTEIFSALLFLAFLIPDWTTQTRLMIGLPAVGLFALWFFPYSKSLWMAVDFWTDVSCGNMEDPAVANVSFQPRKAIQDIAQLPANPPL